MKTNKLFRVQFAKADVIYSVFKNCNVFTLLLGDDLIPIYDFSGNSFRSSLNNLRKYYSYGKVKFYRSTSFNSQPSLPAPYRLTYSDCILFF